MTDLNFGQALEQLVAGKTVARAHWNADHKLDLEPADETHLPFIFMTVGANAADLQGKCVPWVASQTDMLATDWFVVETD